MLGGGILTCEKAGRRLCERLNFPDVKFSGPENNKWRYMNIRMTSIKTLLFGVFIFTSTGGLSAEENGRTASEESNLNKALYCMEILENRPDLEPSYRIGILRNECYSEDFVEHAPNIHDGRDALLSLFASRYKKYPELSMSIKRAASDGDLVWLHLHVKHTPESLGGAGIHIFRMKEGKIVEHWGVGQSVPKESKNNNTMF